MSASPEVLAAARAHLAQGRAIVAVRADKRPWGDAHDGKNWRRHFALAEIEARLRGSRCVAIGFLGGDLNNSIVPLDFDTKEGEQWWRDRCEAAGIDADDFPTVITPGKIKPNGARNSGRHRYVTDIRGTLGNSEGQLKKLGINVRGNGHAMLPPSPHPDGGDYAWAPQHSLDDFSDGIPACPDFIYEAIDAARWPAERSHEANGLGKTDDSAYAYCRAALNSARYALASTSTGSRNQALNDTALALAHLAHYAAFTEGEVRAALQAACEANGYIADDGRQAFEATFGGAWKDGLMQPREIPEREPRLARHQTHQISVSPPSVEAPPKISACSTARWLNRVAQPIEWAIDGLMPRRMVTLLTAEGGAGKSMLEQAACAAIAGGQVFLGKSVNSGSAGGLFAEDSEDVLHGRHERICKEYGIDPAAITGRCFISSYFGHDAVLWRDGGPTQLMVDLEVDLRTIEGLVLFPIDNAALVYAGDENDRTEVTQFMAALNGLANRLATGIVLTTHKSKSTDGSALRAVSGTTAWVNAARHVLDLQPETTDHGPSLAIIKSNCTKPGESIPLAWLNGVLTSRPKPDAFEDRLGQSRLTQMIREMVRDGCSRGVPYSSAAQASDRYLPAALVRKGFKLKDARSAMMNMIDSGILKMSNRSGKRRAGLMISADEHQTASDG